MTLGALFARLSGHAGLNSFLTNRIPRRAATRLVGWFSRIEQPLVRDASIAVFRVCCEPDLSEARKQSFSSLRDCFIRELADGRRPVDPRGKILVSPCDGIVGAVGRIEDGVMLQVKGSSYTLAELVQADDLIADYRQGMYVTLRLTAGMYHRFHAPHDCRIVEVAHIAGDAWNVNPPTLARVPRVYCRNERAVVRLRLDRDGYAITLVPVAAVLVAGIKLHAVDMPGDRRHTEPWSRPCDIPVRKGEEMGWFEHGSTIIVLAPPGFVLCEAITQGRIVRMGEPLLRLPSGGCQSSDGGLS